jgi:ABC-2 type transport system ATP-binding protein
LKQGEIVGLLGVNGAGKSTLMKIMSGILQPDSGKVQLFDRDIEKCPLEVKPKIGYLSEDNPLYEDMYVTEYISFVANLFDVGKEKVDDIIKQVGLKNECHKKISTLSKGNRQRVGIAQALVHNPDFIILDEPTSGLDPNQRDALNRLFIELGREKIILLSTHMLQDVKEVCSRVILIDKGQIVLDEKIEHIESVESMFHQLTNGDNSR